LQATVTDTAPGQASTPTGTVVFYGNRTDSFTPASCTLTAVDASSANCSVSYTPNAGPNQHSISAHYQGQSPHRGSTGSTQVTVT
jgi:hypothetical protein